ncbi:TolC family protein [Longimicrobium terrae]|uniref:Outer membrane protein TolC n=1 Tax=Longimicrobium terrae TaxID=1639882 RepID=A0A841H0S9_9BACT|nr:TolC family protein [Longimicrobium terrae]MBB6071681.1 outer membrane protein TolC [Longimicrobium terrae]NNC28442.1 TolC family protein [Longimicrobium terrae]
MPMARFRTPRSTGAAFVLALALSAPLGAQARDTLDLPLSTALNLAQSGEEVGLATNRVDAASAAVGSARAATLPSVRIGSTFSHVYENARAQAVGAIFNQPNTYGANATLSVPLFQGGRATQGVRQASRLRQAAQSDLQQTQVDVSLLTLRAYLTAQLADQLVAIQDTNVALAEARVRQAEQFEAGGRGSRYDVLRARVERSNLIPLRIQARGDRDLALLELRRITNLPEDQPLRLTTVLDEAGIRAVADAATGAALVDSAALDALPGVRAARLRAQASDASVRIARSALLPTVSVNLVSGYQAYPADWQLPIRGGSLDRIDCPAGSEPTRVCTQQNGGWFSDRSLAVQVSWPLFDGFRARNDVRQARAQARVADLQAQQVWEDARTAAASARTQLQSARAVFEAGRLNAAEAEEAFRLASLRYARGLGTQLDVSDAQLALLTARTNQARAAFDLYLASAELARSLGRPLPSPGAATAP